MISALYAAAARRRREWYAVRPHVRRRLRRPVVSIGNIAAGGRGKTPLAATVARLLLDAGERPAILSRGYGRLEPDDGVVVVRDADGVRADLRRAGDEPFMLARQLPGVVVAVSPDRYLAGRLAEHQFGATVHVLDDGFQHMQLDRDVDVVLVGDDDLAASTLPSGPLREPPDVLVAADAIVAAGAGEVPASHAPVFRARRRLGSPVHDGAPLAAGATVLAAAGIAAPQQFFKALPALDVAVAATRTFRDHHAYTAHDVAELFAAAHGVGAAAVLTTEKDYVRLLPYRPFALPVAWVPLTMEPEPMAPFRDWLVAAVAAARDVTLG